MGNPVASTNLQVDAGVTGMTIPECVAMGHGLETVGVKSAVYLGSKLLQAAIPPIIQDAKDLDAAEKDVEATHNAFLASVNVRDAVRNRFNLDASAGIAVAKAVCKTAQELNQLTLQERSANTGTPTMPTKVLAKPGKNKGSGLVHCPVFGGFNQYECELSTDPIGPATFVLQAGTQARRTIGNLVSGQRYWVRFRTRRGKLVSDWSEAVSFVAK